MIRLPVPVNVEEMLDAFSFFEQIIADYYIETKKMFDVLTELRQEICKMSKYQFEELIDKFLYFKQKIVLISTSEIEDFSFYSRPKVPECRSYKPVSYNELRKACRKFVKECQVERCLVLGVRTAGSWGGAILINELSKKNIESYYHTIRPIKKIRIENCSMKIPFHFVEEEYELMIACLNKIEYSCVILVDDPIYTGRTINAISNFLKEIGVDKIVYFPLGNINPEIKIEADIFKVCYSEKLEFINNLKKYLDKKLNLKVENNLSIQKETLHGTKLVFSDMNDGLYVAKYVGAGWYGKIELERGLTLQKFMLPIVEYMEGFIICKDDSNKLTLKAGQCDKKGKNTELIKQYEEYFDIVEKNYSFRKFQTQKLIWYENSFKVSKWYTGENIINFDFEAGHWGKLLCIPIIISKDLTLLQCQIEDITKMVDKHIYKNTKFECTEKQPCAACKRDPCKWKISMLNLLK